MARLLRNTLMIAALVALAAVPASAQDSVAGKWIFTMSSPDVGELEVPFEFAQSGTEVTGTLEFPMPEIEGAEMSDGLYEDGVFSFLMNLSAQGQWFTVEMEADVDGDEMVGEAYVAEMGMSMPFTAKRADG
ncbi:MAG: hypothetical protein AAF389_11975 [Gemmatimonadota bacterium]